MHRYFHEFSRVPFFVAVKLLYAMPIRGTNIITGRVRIFATLQDAADYAAGQTGFQAWPTNIKKVCDGHRISAYGCTWELV